MARPNVSSRFARLERAVWVIGIISMFASLTALFRISLNFVDFELSHRHCQRFLKNLKKTMEDDKNRILWNKTRDECPHENVIKTVYFTWGLQAIPCIVYFILSVQLVYGVKMGRPKLLLPWIFCQAAPIFYSFMGIFAPINPPMHLNLFFFIIGVCFLLTVFSYYNEATSTERPVAVTVVAVTQTPSGLTVKIPTPGKDDAPPAYPGYISEFNPAYSSTDETSNPPYTSCNCASPPPYSQIIQQNPGTTQQNQGNTTSEHSPQSSSQSSAAASPAETCREAVPLVKKSSQSTE